MAILGAVAWLVGDVLNGMQSASVGVRLWNVSVRGGVFFVTAYSISMLRYAFYHERELARTDALTGTSNWRDFCEVAGREIARAQRSKLPMTLAYFDIDNFKIVNDTAGHDEGNVILREVADTLKRTVRTADVVARIGGDEFVVLFPDQNQDGASAAIRKTRVELDALCGRYNDAIGFSIGVVTAIVAPENIDALVQAADALMYEVKADGKSGCRFALYAGAPSRPEGGNTGNG
jgi:diguanylate cyclase (GGDEF)-like protein